MSPLVKSCFHFSNFTLKMFHKSGFINKALKLWNKVSQNSTEHKNCFHFPSNSPKINKCDGKRIFIFIHVTLTRASLSFAFLLAVWKFEVGKVLQRVNAKLRLLNVGRELNERESIDEPNDRNILFQPWSSRCFDSLPTPVSKPLMKTSHIGSSIYFSFIFGRHSVPNLHLLSHGYDDSFNNHLHDNQ